MKILAFDLAYEKPTTGYDPQKKKNFEVGAGEEKFEEYLKKLKKPHLLLFEPGQTVYMLMAFQRGHKPMYASTATTCEFRKTIGREKTDELDPEMIYLCFRADKQFYEFEELDSRRAMLRLLSRMQTDVKKEKQREMNRRYAAEHNYKLSNVGQELIDEVFEQRNAFIESKKKEKAIHERIMGKKLKEFALPEWVGFLEQIKGVGPVIGAMIIGLLANADIRFNRAGLRHYCRAVPDKYQGVPGKGRKMVDKNGRRDLACILYLLVKGIIFAKDPNYYRLYLKKKAYKRKKNPDWEPYKLDRTAGLCVKQRFLTDFRNFLAGMRNGNN